MEAFVTEAEKAHYREQGYIVKRGAIAREEIAALTADIQDIVEKAASGEGPDIPWINKEKRLPARFGQILRPGYQRPSFVRLLEEGPFFPVCEQLMDFPARYCLCTFVANGDGQPYIQDWHRDEGVPEGWDELAFLQHTFGLGIQTNAPLFPDRFFQCVPGSHLRPATAEERRVVAENPAGAMPGQVTLGLEPGDVAFYFANLWHRGYNPDGDLRWTLIQAFMRADAPVEWYDQGQDRWIETPGYLEALPPTLRAAMRRYLEAIPKGKR